MASVTRFSRLLPARYQRLGTIDTLVPVPFDTVAPPDRDRTLEAVVATIAGLAGSGAIDEDTADVMDGLIDSWLAEGLARIGYLYLDRRHALETIIAVSQQEAARRTSRAADASAKAEAAAKELATAREFYFAAPTPAEEP